jgi:hypothetical protein
MGPAKPVLGAGAAACLAKAPPHGSKWAVNPKARSPGPGGLRMSTFGILLFALAWIGLMLWQLHTGAAAGNWRRPRIYREESPFAYWSTMTVQFLILVLILAKGRSMPWHR